MSSEKNKLRFIIMGVSGSGKSTIGKCLAIELGISFYDADDFHPETNIAKMASGQALNDDDRFPWLEILQKNITIWSDEGFVLACSALKQSYRDILNQNQSEYVQWIYLKGKMEIIQKRMANRQNHFFDPALLQSQFDTLEEPLDAITIGIDDEVDRIIENIKNQL